MNSLRSIVARIGLILPTVLGVVVLTFLIGRVFAPDPVHLFVPPQADEQMREDIRERMGLDAPLGEQFMIFLAGLTRGDLGRSTNTNQPVTQDLFQRLPATVELAAAATLGAILVGIPLGVVAASRRNGWFDRFARMITLFGMAAPTFWLGLSLILIFSVRLGWLPGPIGRLPLGHPTPEPITGLLTVDAIIRGDTATLTLALRHLLLPALTLGFVTMAPIARIARASVVDVMASDYVRTAWALGFPPRTIYARYVLKNALLPIVTFLASVFGFVFAGSVLIEAVFNWPGVGKYGLDAILRSDFSALQGVVLWASVAYIGAYLLVDLFYLTIDPRTRPS